jgi:predicted RNA-binding protein with TRAM domain
MPRALQWASFLLHCFFLLFSSFILSLFALVTITSRPIYNIARALQNAYVSRMHLLVSNVESEECLFSPKKRAPRNAKNRHGKGINYPVKIGEEYEVDIVDMNPNGAGIARIKGFPIFVSNAKRNEHLKIKITNLISGCADAQIIP